MQLPNRSFVYSAQAVDVLRLLSHITMSFRDILSRERTR